ncbi:phosphoglycerate dehydrogenase [Anaeromyxobacter diazotrophicus]|uniref:D-3-phosphoglycerate dehydrogenase n=1 Tax=Anaeromyxobacter diazotrophicus TaxID=2590199 RepID=A0A7I9VPH1_9BACT|nr:phosphoglycerate dehydrogenase [Anaeromyxobacter diazotrophicus]GEJ58039.1 D-3-phosphoglycerate dehydrogenase [Anaeromyxobacter diazotrophicus]
MAPRVLVADDLSSEGVALLQQAGLTVDVRVGLPPAELERVIGEYDALAVRSATQVTARLLERATRLKVVGRAGVGVDNVDLEAATRRGVVVMNTPGGSSTTVAELTLAHMLALARHVAQATASVKAGRWEKKKFQGRELAGKTLGVVGIGNIGSIVVARCLAMKMRVVAYDPFISADAAAQLGVTQVALEDLWPQADVISLHVPLTEQTRNLVDAATLRRMKKGALLVNCARGGVIDERALAEALASGHLGGAALDVFEKEPPPPDHPLLALDGFICTPHLGASTEEAQAAVAVAIAQQLAAYLTRGEVKNAVNLPSVPREVLDRLAPYLALAERLGSLAAQIAPASIGEVRLELAGELSRAPHRVLAAQVLKGLLRHVLDQPVNEVSAPAIARERGIVLREDLNPEARDYVAELTVTLRGGGGEAVVAGTVFGRHELRVVRVNQFRLEAVPEGDIIMCENDDAPGVVGRLGTALGQAGVNIARIYLSRDAERRSAFSLINVDSAPGQEVLEALRRLEHVRAVRSIRL